MSAVSPAALADWRQLTPEERRDWWSELWLDAIALEQRYRLALRRGWWEDPLQVETLAALAAWTRLYDSGAWEDPPGKLNLLSEVDRARERLRAGERAFHPDTDQPAFERHLHTIGCQPPKRERPTRQTSGQLAPTEHHAQLRAQLERLHPRRAELEHRAQLLGEELEQPNRHDRARRRQLQGELTELERTLSQLREHEAELSAQLEAK